MTQFSVHTGTGNPVTKNILYKKVGGIQDLMAIGGVKSKETRSYQQGKSNSPIFSTQITYGLNIDKYNFPF